MLAVLWCHGVGLRGWTSARPKIGPGSSSSYPRSRSRSSLEVGAIPDTVTGFFLRRIYSVLLLERDLVFCSVFGLTL